MSQPEPFRFHIVTGEVSGSGCFFSNDYLEGMVDDHGQPVRILHSFPADHFIQNLLYGALIKTPANVSLDDVGFWVTRDAFRTLLQDVAEYGRSSAVETLSAGLGVTSGEQMCSEGPEVQNTPFTEATDKEIDELLTGPDGAKIHVSVQILMHAIGVRFHTGWITGKQEIERMN